MNDFISSWVKTEVCKLFVIGWSIIDFVALQTELCTSRMLFIIELFVLLFYFDRNPVVMLLLKLLYT